MRKHIAPILVGLVSVVLVVGVPIVGAQGSPVQPGDQVTVNCSGSVTATIEGNVVTLDCAPGVPPAPGAAEPPNDHSAHPDGLGDCGQPQELWHAPVINGCVAGEEHGDAPPDWIATGGYKLLFHGPFNTSPVENTAKHAAMKGFSTQFNNVGIYFRIHAASNPLDRSARFHSYELFARDSSGAVSHFQGWYNSGDPTLDRIPRRPSGDSDRRPIILVVDQTAWNQGIRCEQWYGFTAGWSWDFGWTICNATTLYQPGENATAVDQSTWTPAPDGSLGTTRRLEAARYGDRGAGVPRDQTFWATQFGDIVSGPNDPACSDSSTQFGVSYNNVCLEQYIASSLPAVKYPGNAQQKLFDATGVHLPN